MWYRHHGICGRSRHERSNYARQTLSSLAEDIWAEEAQQNVSYALATFEASSFKSLVASFVAFTR